MGNRNVLQSSETNKTRLEKAFTTSAEESQAVGHSGLGFVSQREGIGCPQGRRPRGALQVEIGPEPVPWSGKGTGHIMIINCAQQVFCIPNPHTQRFVLFGG